MEVLEFCAKNNNINERNQGKIFNMIIMLHVIFFTNVPGLLHTDCEPVQTFTHLIEFK